MRLFAILFILISSSAFARKLAGRDLAVDIGRMDCSKCVASRGLYYCSSFESTEGLCCSDNPIHNSNCKFLDLNQYQCSKAILSPNQKFAVCSYNYKICGEITPGVIPQNNMIYADRYINKVAVSSKFDHPHICVWVLKKAELSHVYVRLDNIKNTTVHIHKGYDIKSQ